MTISHFFKRAAVAGAALFLTAALLPAGPASAEVLLLTLSTPSHTSPLRTSTTQSLRGLSRSTLRATACSLTTSSLPERAGGGDIRAGRKRRQRALVRRLRDLERSLPRFNENLGAAHILLTKVQWGWLRQEHRDRTRRRRATSRHRARALDLGDDAPRLRRPRLCCGAAKRRRAPDLRIERTAKLHRTAASARVVSVNKAGLAELKTGGRPFMSIRVKAPAAAVAVALSVTPAFAEILNFSWDYAPGEVATWSQPSNPTPVAFDGVSTLGGGECGTNNLGQKFQRVWYDNIDVGNGGSKSSNFLRFSNRLSDFHRPPVCADIFPGSISCRIFSRPVCNRHRRCPPVPEPSTWAMMLIGFAGLGYAAVRRKGAVRAISA